LPLEPGQPITDPRIGAGMLTVERTHVQIVFELPQALPGKTQMLHPEDPDGGKDTNVTFTFGVVVSNGLGFPLKRTPDCALDQR